MYTLPLLWHALHCWPFSPSLQYFALQILETLIRTRWKALPREQCEGQKRTSLGQPCHQAHPVLEVYLLCVNNVVYTVMYMWWFFPRKLYHFIWRSFSVKCDQKLLQYSMKQFVGNDMIVSFADPSPSSAGIKKYIVGLVIKLSSEAATLEVGSRRGRSGKWGGVESREGWKEHKLAKEGELGRKQEAWTSMRHLYLSQKYFDNRNFRICSRTQFTSCIFYFPTAREGLCCKAEHHPCTGMFSLHLTSAIIIYGDVSSSLLSCMLITTLSRCVTVVLSSLQIVKQEWPRNWPTFISDIVGASKTSESLCTNNMAIFKLLRWVSDWWQRWVSSRMILIWLIHWDELLVDTHTHN